MPKTKVRLLVCQVYEVEVNADPALVQRLYPNFGSALPFMERDKIETPECFGKLLDTHKSLIDCQSIQVEPQTSENLEFDLGEILEGELV